MPVCKVCNTAYSFMVKRKGEYVCGTCFVDESPIIDEGWRILKEVIDSKMVWEDMTSIEQGRRKNEKRRLSHY